MTTTQRRIALLTGASLATLGFAAPAYAALPADGTYPATGQPTVDDTIEICDLATPPGNPCFFGVVDTTGASSTARNGGDFTKGSIQQIPGTGTATISQNGSAQVGYVASAVNGLGDATANATGIALLFQSNNFGVTVA